MKRSQVIVYLFLLIGFCLARYSKLTRQPPQVLIPPVAEKQPRVVPVHGDIRFDDYAWLREKDTRLVVNYLKVENEYTESRLRHLDELDLSIRGFASVEWGMVCHGEVGGEAAGGDVADGARGRRAGQHHQEPREEEV